MQKYVVYKPNSSRTGSALSIDFNKFKKSIFLEFAKQKEERAFDWQNKLIFKLNPQDVAKMSVLLRDKKDSMQLFHDPNKSKSESTIKNAVLKIAKNNFGYNFRINQQEKNNNINSISINLAEDEIYILQIIFNKAIEQIYFS